MTAAPPPPDLSELRRLLRDGLAAIESMTGYQDAPYSRYPHTYHGNTFHRTIVDDAEQEFCPTCLFISEARSLLSDTEASRS